MGVLYCLFTKIDFDTGQTPEIAHTSLGDDMGGLGYNTIQKAVTALRKAGVITYAGFRGRGTVWSDGQGKANRYQMTLPGEDPSQKLGGGVPKKEADPLPKTGNHFKKPSLSDGNEGTPSRREGDKVPDPSRKEELQLLSQWTSQHGYSTASRMIEDWRSNQAVAAE